MGRIFDFYENNENYREEPKFPVPISQAGNATFYHGKWHDYIYYPEPVENAEGVRYRAGYYDETGKYYSELKLYHSFPEEGLVCKYCGHRMTEDELEGMETLKCPNCDASFELVTPADVVKKDKVVTSEVRFTDKSEAQARRYVSEMKGKEKKSARKRAAYDPEYNQDYDEELSQEKEKTDMNKVWLNSLCGIEEAIEPEQYEEKKPRNRLDLVEVAFLLLLIGGLPLFLVICAFLSGVAGVD